MIRSLSIRWAVCLGLACICVAGCDRKPSPPTTPEGDPIQFVEVTAEGEKEYELAEAMQRARIQYIYRISVLEGFYSEFGNADKLRWARRELENIKSAQTFEWRGLHEIPLPPGTRVDSADERLLVELAVRARRTYKQAVQDLREFYEQSEQPLKAQLIRNTQSRLDPVRTYMYFLDAEIPGPDLEPVRVVPEADQLYQEALRLHKRTKYLPLLADYREQRQALMKLLELVEKHPESTRIALAAYYIAEIYKEYFNENLRAVHWYQRAWQWDPMITKPARFQAATVYDLRLHEPDKAIELYRASLEHDPSRTLNRQHAQNRIVELLELQNIRPRP
jgi:tetratricopeptide (TPR) repeat protein